MEKIISNVAFYEEKESFQILFGTKSTYEYSELLKCEVVYEHAKYHNEKCPFPIEHRLLITRYNFLWINRKVYVGLELELKGEKKAYVYVSNKERILNSDDFNDDVKIAEGLRKKFIEIIERYKFI
ncbi:hypothetical protein WKT02_07150 [Erysipelotrichaceae bacterium HCN-30851]